MNIDWLGLAQWLIANWLSVSIVVVCGVIALQSALTSKSEYLISNQTFPVLVFGATLLAAFFAKDHPQYGITGSVVFLVLGVSTFQYSAFILSSRAKERSSNVAVALTGLLSHSSYYLLFGVLASIFSSKTTVIGLTILFIPYFAGMIIGRLAFKKVARSYDARHTADATQGSEEMLWWFGRHLPSKQIVTRVLAVGVFLSLTTSYWWWKGSFDQWLLTSIIILAFPIIMSIGGTVVPRLMNRNKVGPATIAALSSGFAFPFMAAYLISTDFPLAFLLLYTCVSSLGSVVGRLISERLERLLHIRPDQGVYAGNKAVIQGIGITLVLVFVAMATLHSVGLVTGLPANDDTPLWLVNTNLVFVALLFCGFIIAQSFTHGISSRFGKRNEPGEGDRFHARSLVAHGLVMFPYTILQLGTLNDLKSFPIFLTIMVLSGALGGLLAKEYGERVETRFGLTMS